METLNGTDALAIMNSRNNGYGYGYDGFGCGSWFWIIILLFFCRGGNWGDNQTLTSEEFIKRDIFNTNQNVSTTACQTQRDVLEGKYDTQIAINNASAKAQECCCETNRNIDSVRYDTLLNFKDMQAQLAQCCCTLQNTIHAEGEETRGLIQANTIQDLRDRINERDRELQSAQFQISQVAQTSNIVDTLRPYPTPSYIVSSPYTSYGCYGYNGCNC